MKVTVQINGIDTEIELTAEQVASIEEQKKPKQFETVYSKGNTYILDTYYNRIGDGNDSKYLEHGRYRKTKESAEMSLVRNKRANRFEALVDQLDGMKEFVEGEENWYVYFKDSNWSRGYTKFLYEPDKVYMTKECAIKVCKILNAGEYEL